MLPRASKMLGNQKSWLIWLVCFACALILTEGWNGTRWVRLTDRAEWAQADTGSSFRRRGSRRRRNLPGNVFFGRRNSKLLVLPGDVLLLVGGNNEADAVTAGNDAGTCGNMEASHKSFDGGRTWNSTFEHIPIRPLYRATAAALSDGTVVVVGGAGSITAKGRRRLTRLPRVYASSGGYNWTRLQDFPGNYGDGSEDHSMVTLTNNTCAGCQDRLLVIGGTRPREIWMSGPGGRGWTSTGSFPEPIARHQALTLSDGSVIVGGGYLADNGGGHLWRGVYPFSNWSIQKEAPPFFGRVPRFGFQMILNHDGSILIMAGVHQPMTASPSDAYGQMGVSVDVGDVWRGTDNGRTWTLQTPMATFGARRYGAAAVLSTGRVVLVGGEIAQYYTGILTLADVWAEIEPCAPGYQLTSGASECTPCPSGATKIVMGNGPSEPLEASCTPCSSGRYHDPGMAVTVECQACQPGEYQKHAGQTACEFCPAGKFGNRSESTICTLCKPGYISSAAGSTACFQCDAGTVAESGDNQCVSCRPGQYALAASSSCKVCPSGRYSFHSSEKCLFCVAGEIPSKTKDFCTPCPAGFAAASRAAGCSPCAAGKYAEKAQSECLLCPAGYQPHLDKSKCIICNAGFFAANGSAVCTACAAGTYALAASELCMLCPTDTFSGKASGVCSKCPPGNYAGNGSSHCTPCPAGTYGQIGKDGALECQQCPPFSNSTLASVERWQCFCDIEVDQLQGSFDSQGLYGCGCKPGYHMDHGSLSCNKCGEGVECKWQGDWSASLAVPKVAQAYWSTWVLVAPGTGTLRILRSTPARVFRQHDVYKCFSSSTCLGDSLCAEGRGGIACGSCLPGRYGGPDGTCRECSLSPGEQRKAIVLVAFIAVPVGLLIIRKCSTRDGAHRIASLKGMKIAAKLLTKYLQHLMVIAKSSITWPSEVTKLFNAMGAYSVNVDSGLGLGCMWEQQTVPLIMSCRWAMPLILIVQCLLACGLSQFLQQLLRALPSDRAKGTKIGYTISEAMEQAFTLLEIFFATIMQSAFAMLTCSACPNGAFTVLDFPEVPCYETKWWSEYFPPAAAAVLVYGFGFLGLRLYIIWSVTKARSLSIDARDKGNWAFAVDDFRDSTYHWILDSTMKDIALNLIVVVLPSNGSLQLALSGLITLHYLLKCKRTQPYADDHANTLECCLSAGLLLQITFACAAGFQTNDLETTDSGDAGTYFLLITYGTMCSCVWFFAITGLSMTRFVKYLPLHWRPWQADEIEEVLETLEQRLESWDRLQQLMNNMDSHELRVFEKAVTTPALAGIVLKDPPSEPSRHSWNLSGTSEVHGARLSTRSCSAEASEERSAVLDAANDSDPGSEFAGSEFEYDCDDAAKSDPASDNNDCDANAETVKMEADNPEPFPAAPAPKTASDWIEPPPAPQASPQAIVDLDAIAAPEPFETSRSVNANRIGVPIHIYL